MDLRDLAGGVAVLTGAASIAGLGYALAQQCGKLRMHVLVSDVRAATVDAAVAALAAEMPPGCRVCGWVCDHRVMDRRIRDHG